MLHLVVDKLTTARMWGKYFIYFLEILTIKMVSHFRGKYRNALNWAESQGDVFYLQSFLSRTSPLVLRVKLDKARTL